MLTKGGSQSTLCSVPMRYDSYLGCAHGCTYCFATKATKTHKRSQFNKDKQAVTNFSCVERGHIKQLENFLKSGGNLETHKYQEGVPIHWGGMSDGFQPIERKERISYESLKLLAQYKYPVIISTKGIPIITSNEYIELLKECKCVVQISMLSNDPKKFDRGTVDYPARIIGIRKLLHNGIKVVIRNQPYMMHLHKSVMNMIDDLEGVHGIVVEGMKDRNKFANNLTRVGGEWMYPLLPLMRKFKAIKEKCKRSGILFYAGENRLRWMGESVNCCGAAQIKGFEGENKLNTTQLFFFKKITFSNMKVAKGPAPMSGIVQSTVASREIVKFNKRSESNEGFYDYLRNWVNHGNFESFFELMAVGVDANGNKIFEFQDEEVERERLRTVLNC